LVKFYSALTVTDNEYILIEKLKKGDDRALEKIFLTHYTNLCNYAYEFVHDTSTAEDIVSDAFVWMWENREKLTIKTSLQSYLFKIVHNRCINYIQKLKVRDRYSKDKILLTTSENHKTLGNANHPLNMLISKEMQERITKAIENLPPQCKEIFKLNRFHGLKNKEIAEKLHISELTVKKQMTIALKKLREMLFYLSFMMLNHFF
jgi:RNA polymerase sigma-70 factor, ECF subfamily